jgi:hypothetical protein
MPLRYSFVVVSVIAMTLAILGLFWIARQSAAEQAAQRHAGQIVEQKLCATLAPLGSLSSLEAPAGNPASNPSRAFEQRLVAKLQPLAELGADLGCPKSTTGGKP